VVPFGAAWSSSPPPLPSLSACRSITLREPHRRCSRSSATIGSRVPSIRAEDAGTDERLVPAARPLVLVSRSQSLSRPATVARSTNLTAPSSRERSARQAGQEPAQLDSTSLVVKVATAQHAGHVTSYTPMGRSSAMRGGGTSFMLVDADRIAVTAPQPAVNPSPPSTWVAVATVVAQPRPRFLGWLKHCPHPASPGGGGSCGDPRRS
jgi:hypothetical protein